MTPKIAIAHDFFFQNGGAEQVVESLLDIYPQAQIYTSIFIVSKFRDKPNLSKAWLDGRVRTTFAQSIFGWNNGFLLRYFKHFFWLYPVLMRFVTISNYDCLIISSTDCAKQVRVQNVQKILNYCHTPTRYLHGLTTEQDHNTLPWYQKIVLPLFETPLRILDLNAVKYLNSKGCVWIANSKYIQSLIKSIYHSNSILVYPPVEIEKYLEIERTPDSSNASSNRFFLCHGRISFHKRLDLAINACLNLNIKLKISGSSASESQMKSLLSIVEQAVKRDSSKKGLIEFLGRTSAQELCNLLATTQGFLFPGKEDFGIAPIEMLASGIPIVAYKGGGALEYILPGVNGIFSKEQTLESFESAILEFQTINNWDSKVIRNSAIEFKSNIFRDKIQNLLEN